MINGKNYKNTAIRLIFITLSLDLFCGKIVVIVFITNKVYVH